MQDAWRLGDLYGPPNWPLPWPPNPKFMACEEFEEGEECHPPIDFSSFVLRLKKVSPPPTHTQFLPHACSSCGFNLIMSPTAPFLPPIDWIHLLGIILPLNGFVWSPSTSFRATSTHCYRGMVLVFELGFIVNSNWSNSHFNSSIYMIDKKWIIKIKRRRR